MEEGNAPVLQAFKEPAGEGFSVLVDPERPALESIVFVHGFTGHPQRTWTRKGEVYHDRQRREDDNDERPSKFRKLLSSASLSQMRSEDRGAVYWPRDLLPITALDARVLIYGYDTRIRYPFGPAESKITIYDIAGNFLVGLEAERRLEPSRLLLFIAHSLGGIVVKEALRQSHGCEGSRSCLRSIYESTSSILFFGTPHGGPDPGGLLHRTAKKVLKTFGVSVDEQIVKALLPSSERLRELRDEFGPMVRQNKWIVYCFQEQYGVTGLNNNKVVDDVASCLNDSEIEITQHIASNHTDMCRFRGPDDVEYRKVAAAISRVLGATARLAPIDVPPVLNPDKRQSYLDSLSFKQIDARHATIKTAHAKTCSWLLDKSEYQDWDDVNKTSEHHGFLWIKGKPGTGKSTIMKFAYSNAKKKSTDSIIVISFFFNARGERLEKVVEGMYQSLFFQLLDKLPELQVVFDSLERIVPVQGDSYQWDIETLKHLFSSAIEKVGRRQLMCFIDALDECEEDQVREMVAFFEQLGHLAVSFPVRFQVCFSSRHYPHISISKSVQLILEGQEGHQQDIAKYLDSKLKARRGKDIEGIKAEIRERASGIFLWVVLVVQMLNKEYDRGRIHALRKRLDEIPDGLDELFKDILTRDGENMPDLILCLQWLLYAKRPLKREELYFAILAGVEPDGVTAWDVDRLTKEDMERFIISSSKGLAEVTKSKHQTVQFIHESVRDFLLKGQVLHTLRSEFSNKLQRLGHDRLKQCCHSYMSIDLSKHLSFPTPLPTASSDEAANLRRFVSGKFPFLEYAVRHVLHHADAAVGDGVSQERFIENFPLGEWITLDNLFEKYQIRRHKLDASLLYILAEENLPNLIRIELKRVPHMDIKGERYGFPLLAALANANKGAVKALLTPYDDVQSDNGMPHNQPDCVTAGDLEQAIEHLLENGRDIILRKTLTKQQKTLLEWAVQTDAGTLVNVLLATRKVSGEGCNYLLRDAAKSGYEGIFKQLLAAGIVDPDSKDSKGGTPLWIAAYNGHEAVVKLLLATGKVDPDFKDSAGRTPLYWAAYKGYEAVVKLLLATGKVDPGSKDTEKRTPLWMAAYNGHEAVVKLLLATGKVDLDSKNLWGQTPLLGAAKAGHEAVVKLLLATGRVDPDFKNSRGETPLLQAAANGHEAVVKLLLATENVDPDSRDSFERTPLWWAAANGQETLVKLLLATGEVDPDPKDLNGQTPLSGAAGAAHEAVVKLLLATGEVDPVSTDSRGRTPLSQAEAMGHKAIVKLLLDHAKLNSTIPHPPRMQNDENDVIDEAMTFIEQV